MNEKYIEGAGIVIVRESKEKKIEHLFLKNKSTNYWEPPKGELDISENFIVCALRELKEETGLDFDCRHLIPIGPYSVSYNIGEIEKQIFFFAIHLIQNGERVYLSEEHDEYIWESARKLNKLVTKSYSNILNQVNDDFSRVHDFLSFQIKYQKYVTDFLKKLIEDYELNKGVDWYLTGSVAALENTFNGNFHSLSDIDLVAIISDKSLNTNELSHFINSEIKRELKVTCGINYISNKESINLNEPFWQYFEKYKLPLTANKFPLNFENSLTEQDIGYNIFRVIWYTLLRSNFYFSDSKEYLFIKGIILLNYVGKNRLFKGYKELFLELSLQQKNGKKRSAKEQDLLDALAVKLNLKRINKNWRNVFLKHALISIGKIKTHTLESNLSIALLNREIGEIQKSRELIYSILHNNILHKKYETQFNSLNLQNENDFWLILLIIRKIKWPHYFKYSGFKYNNYFAYFLGKSEISDADKMRIREFFTNIKLTI